MAQASSKPVPPRNVDHRSPGSTTNAQSGRRPLTSKPKRSSPRNTQRQAIRLLSPDGPSSQLEDLLGRPVDLVLVEGLKARVRGQILREAIRAA